MLWPSTVGVGTLLLRTLDSVVSTSSGVDAPIALISLSPQSNGGGSYIDVSLRLRNCNRLRKWDPFHKKACNANSCVISLYIHAAPTGLGP